MTAGAPEIRATLTITLNAAGEIGLQGPIGDRLLCYGLLEIAKDLIRQQGEKAKAPLITTAPAGVLRVLPRAPEGGA